MSLFFSVNNRLSYSIYEQKKKEKESGEREDLTLKCFVITHSENLHYDSQLWFFMPWRERSKYRKLWDTS